MFYDRFERLCAERGVSCNKAASDMGLSNATATKWKKTGATPNGKTLGLIAGYFNVTVDYLVDMVGQAAIDDIDWQLAQLRERLIDSPNDGDILDAIAVLEEAADDLRIASGLKKEQPAAVSGDGLSERDAALIRWFRSLPPEKQKAILISQDAPQETF